MYQSKMDEVTFILVGVLILLHVDCVKYPKLRSYVGGKIILKCPFQAENSSMQWFRIDQQTVYSNGKKINPNLTNRIAVSVVVNYDDGEYHLSISPLQKEDEGIYRCSAYTEGSLRYQIYSLTVNDSGDIFANSSDIHKQTMSGFQLHIYLIICIGVILTIYGLSLVTVFSVAVAKKYVTFAKTRRNMHQTLDNEANTHNTVRYEDIDQVARPITFHNNTAAVTENLQRLNHNQDLNSNLDIHLHCYEALNA